MRGCFCWGGRPHHGLLGRRKNHTWSCVFDPELVLSLRGKRHFSTQVSSPSYTHAKTQASGGVLGASLGALDKPQGEGVAPCAVTVLANLPYVAICPHGPGWRGQTWLQLPNPRSTRNRTSLFFLKKMRPKHELRFFKMRINMCSQPGWALKINSHKTIL